jgi:L-alanine-DL-glutamate epimerase-like enolase superfamily enzyme
MFAHFFPHFHAQLSARLSDSWGVETVTPEVDGLSDLTEPVSVEGGRVVPQKNPGFGIGWHEDRLERWTVSALLA